MTEQATATRSRSGGRHARRALRTAPKFDMLPGLTRNIPPLRGDGRGPG